MPLEDLNRWKAAIGVWVEAVIDKREGRKGVSCVWQECHDY
jgi:hypothetical protein